MKKRFRVFFYVDTEVAEEESKDTVKSRIAEDISKIIDYADNYEIVSNLGFDIAEV